MAQAASPLGPLCFSSKCQVIYGGALLTCLSELLGSRGNERPSTTAWVTGGRWFQGLIRTLKHSHLRSVNQAAVGLLTIVFYQVLKFFHGAGQAGIHFEHDPEFCYPIPTRRELGRTLSPGLHS